MNVMLHFVLPPRIREDIVGSIPLNWPFWVAAVLHYFRKNQRRENEW